MTKWGCHKDTLPQYSPFRMIDAASPFGRGGGGADGEGLPLVGEWLAAPATKKKVISERLFAYGEYLLACRLQASLTRSAPQM